MSQRVGNEKGGVGQRKALFGEETTARNSARAAPSAASGEDSQPAARTGKRRGAVPAGDMAMAK